MNLQENGEDVSSILIGSTTIASSACLNWLVSKIVCEGVFRRKYTFHTKITESLNDMTRFK